MTLNCATWRSFFMGNPFFINAMMGLMSDTENLTQTLNSKQAIQDGLIELTSNVSQRIDILSSHLPSDIYHNDDLVRGIFSQIRNNRFSHVRILLSDSSKLIRQHHAFLELIRRVPSKIQVRKKHKDDQHIPYGFVLVDHTGHLYQPNINAHTGVMSQRCKETVRRLDEEFSTLWSRSLVDENFSQWII